MILPASRIRLVVGVLSLLLIVVAMILLLRQGGGGSDDASGAARYVANAQAIALRSRAALGGDPKAFDELARRARVLPERDLVTAGLDDDVASDMGRSYSQFATALGNVVNGRDAVIASHDAAAMLRQRLPDTLSRVAEFSAAVGSGERARIAPYVQRVEVELDTMVRDAETLAKGAVDRAESERRLQARADTVTVILDGLAGTSSEAGVPPVNTGTTELAALSSNYADFASAVRGAIEASIGADVVRTDAAQLDAASGAMFGLINTSSRSSAGGGIGRFLPLVPLLLAALGIGALMRSGGGGSSADPNELAQANEQNESNQQAILRLLDEMGSLADGDLTVEATVSEDITGAIADSINYAIEALRELVSTIDGAATGVERLAQQTDASANHLAKSSENQSKQVFAATESIANMAGSIEEVSGNAERSAEVAKHSVKIAHKGAEAVRRTIDGMNTIRETIQDTSKRIKRLGESSQEIGDIVELINDIAEQTNILALNASIQASMAGEAGRGFAVVADEVQRLSERCTNATKQIEVLVKTIQSDTNEAVVSMERSTTDVVSGALLAENAGSSLGEIETVSNQIAGLVENISDSARQQATAAADITRNMGVLQEISAQTAENTGAASRSIKQLAEMSSQLRRSVDGFTLPRDDARPAPAIDEALMEEVAELPPQETLVANVGRK